MNNDYRHGASGQINLRSIPGPGGGARGGEGAQDGGRGCAGGCVGGGRGGEDSRERRTQDSKMQERIPTPAYQVLIR